MSAAHQTERFSEAFDRMLTSSQHAEFDQHLTTCAQCSTEYQQYRGAIEKVRAMPLAKMPTPVRIPADLVPRRSRLDSILGYFRRGRGAATAVGLLAAAGLLLLASRQTSTTPGTATALKPAVLSPNFGANQAAGAAIQAAPKADSVVACTATLVPASGASPPATYADVVTVPGNGGTSTQITVAVPSGTVHAGDTVAVFAHATVSLQTSSAKGATPAQPISIGPCVEASTSGAVQAVNSSSLTNVIVPGSAQPGTKIMIVATVPAGSGGIATLPALQATITLTVQ